MNYDLMNISLSKWVCLKINVVIIYIAYLLSQKRYIFYSCLFYHQKICFMVYNKQYYFIRLLEKKVRLKNKL